MILELIGLYAAYKVADRYNKNHDEIEKLQKRLRILEENSEDYEYRSLRKEIKEIHDKINALS